MPNIIVASDRKPFKCWDYWRFSPDDVYALTGPGVYIFSEHGGAILYVGSSKRVISRCLGMHHREDIRRTANVVEIRPCSTVEQARLLEIKLINELKPRFNKVIPTYYNRLEHRPSAFAPPSPERLKRLEEDL